MNCAWNKYARVSRNNIYKLTQILFSVKPLWVRLQGENRPLSARATYKIGCEVVGARPTPKITWNKGNSVLQNSRQTVRIELQMILDKVIDNFPHAQI